MKIGSRFVEKKEYIPDIRIVLTNYEDVLTISQFGKNGDLLDFRPSVSGRSILGNIYVGKVEKVVKSISACFVDIGICHCFLPFDEYNGENEQPKQGERLVVQIKRDAVKTKEPSCSCYLSLTGRYIVLSEKKDKNTTISISKKCDQKQKRETLREDLLNAFGKLTTETPSGSFHDVVLRTNGIDAFEQSLKELKSIYHTLYEIRSFASDRTDFSLMYKETESHIRYIRDLSLMSFIADHDNPQNPYFEIITDIASVYQQLQELPFELPPCFSVRMYDDEAVPLSSLYRIAHYAKELLSEKVWLKSGAYLVIEQTEALNVIDVNSGKIQPKKGDLNAIYRINEEAAIEAARQIRLRNLSGIILIDFINDKKEGEDKLRLFLSGELKKDRIHTRLIDVTKLGLYELTRQRVEPSLKELFKE